MNTRNKPGLLRSKVVVAVTMHDKIKTADQTRICSQATEMNGLNDKKMNLVKGAIVFLVAIFSTTAFAAGLNDPETLFPRVFGEIRTTTSSGDETLMEVARREGFGFDVVVNSNRAVDPWSPGNGTEIILPGKVIVPYGAQTGLTINLAELRLFHIIERDDRSYQVGIYPLGIGRQGRATPEGVFHINVKQQHPYWRVPEWLRQEDPSLPQVMSPGPNNPLGDYWLGLSAPGYGIHGTNRPFGVGRRISSGCIRMYPHDIAALYARVAIGTPVTISYQPIKATGNGDKLLLEVHPDYLGRFRDPFQHALHVISRTGWAGMVNYSQVRDVVRSQRGIPETVGVRSDE